MAPNARQPAHVTTLARTLLEDGNLSCAAIGARVGVSVRTIRRWRLSFELFGQPYPPLVARIGRPSALTAAQEGWMLAFLDDQPTAYLDELVLALFDQFNVVISAKTVYRLLLRNKWSRKLTRRKALASSLPLRALWSTKADNWRMDQLVFVDESACNERTGWRKRGWSPQGTACSDLISTKRSERWSILPALTVTGYLPGSTLVYQGSITRDLFMAWLENNVLPHLTPQYHILVMDNATIHHGDEVKDLCERFGIEIQYLPPYSPDFNPIEMTFHTLKTWIQRHFAEHVNFETFGHFLVYAVETALGGSEGSEGSERSDLRAYYRKCGYH